MVRSLDLLLEGSTNHNRTNVQPIHRLLSEDPLQSQAGYSALSCSFSLHKLLSCVQHLLTLNPFGMSACLRSGKKLAWDQQGMLLSSQFQYYPVINVAVSKVKALTHNENSSECLKQSWNIQSVTWSRPQRVVTKAKHDRNIRNITGRKNMQFGKQGCFSWSSV